MSAAEKQLPPSDCTDYSQCANPPVLHRQEALLLPDDPHRQRFARLTAQEEKHALLNDPSAIGTKDSWSKRLADRGFALKGHRLLRKTKPDSTP